MSPTRTRPRPRTRTRTRPRTRAAAAAAALLSPLLLAGCGIKPTAPVDSGASASVAVSGPENSAVLYFVSPDGLLVPSPQRDVPTLAPVQALNRLLEGPGDVERAAGLTTQVPPTHGKRLDSSAVSFWHGVMRVQLPFPAADLTPLARRQIVCSVLTTGVPSEPLTVALKGTDPALDLDPVGCEGPA
ncbi:hypothetical protein ACFWP3_37490 [Streptomyces sp. NPDC058525]|uniref:hypothetical protein n=1 Tax=unclassified Streptomyces TaxID=2593676 RepID=UPI00365D9A64